MSEVCHNTPHSMKIFLIKFKNAKNVGIPIPDEARKHGNFSKSDIYHLSTIFWLTDFFRLASPPASRESDGRLL